MSEKPGAEPAAKPGVKPGAASDDAAPTAAGAAKRPPPPRVPAVTIGDTTYQQMLGSAGGFDQSSGLLVAYVGDATVPDWTIAVYEVTYQPNLERDVQEVFFTSMTQRGSESVLVIENERGAVYEVDLDARTSTKVE